MRDTQAHDLLQAAGADIGARVPDADALISAARRRTRRRRGMVLGGVASAVAVIAVSGYLVQPEGAGTVPVTGPTATPQTLSEPPGTRVVGRNGVAVAVPESWSTNAWRCVNDATEDTVIFEPTGGNQYCLVTGPISSLHLAMGDSLEQHVSWLPAGQATVSAHGVEVERTPTVTHGCGGSPCARFVAALIVPDRDVVMWVESPQRETVDAVLDSVQLIPPGYAVVPSLESLTPAEATSALSARGLRADPDVACGPEDLCDRMTVASSDPAQGSVVRAGSRVELRMTPQGELIDLPSRVVCASSNRVGATLDYFVPPLFPHPSIEDAARSWLSVDEGESLSVVRRDAAGATVLVRRANGDPHTRLNLSSGPGGGWRVESYTGCPGYGPGSR